MEPMIHGSSVKDFAIHSKSTQIRDLGTVTTSYSVVESSNQAVDAHSDYSTTLIKDIHPHFDPVELILQSHKTMSNSSTTSYIRDESPRHRHVNKYDAINLIIPKPSFRSESMPPITRSQVKTVHDTAADTDDEIFYYYTDRSPRGKESLLVTPSTHNKVTYYKEIERKTSALQPIELIIDASSLHTKTISASATATTKRMREMSLPTTSRHIKQANIYLTDRNEYF
jgi:hypothetical protein